MEGPCHDSLRLAMTKRVVGATEVLSDISAANERHDRAEQRKETDRSVRDENVHAFSLLRMSSPVSACTLLR